jgi:hypothetical protein
VDYLTKPLVKFFCGLSHKTIGKNFFAYFSNPLIKLT